MTTRDDYLLRIAVQVQNDKALSALTTQLGAAAKSAPKTQRAIVAATRPTAKFGHVAQNTSYQLQDFIVQVQGGTDPMRAMSQQLPQMLVGMGALGAAIGVAAAALPILIGLFRDSDAAAESLSETIDTLESEVSGLSDFMSGIDFSSWNKSWNDSSKAIQRNNLEILRLRALISEAELADRISELAAEAENGAGKLSIWQEALAALGNFFQNTDQWDENLQSINMAEAFGINRSQADALMRMLDQLKAGEITVANFAEQATAMGLNIKGANRELYEFILNAKRLQQAQADLERTSEQISTAGTSIVTGRKLPEKASEKKKKDTGFTERQRSFLEGIREINDAVKEADNNVANYWSLSDHAMQTFGSTFETMLDGVTRGTTNLEDGVKNMVKVLLVELGKLATYKFLATAFAGTALGDIAAGLLPNAKGNAFHNGNLIPFAKGGVVNGPTLFPMAKGMGLMGEAGAEAVMPLKRTPSGDLGVQASGMSVVVNNNAPGVEAIARQTPQGLTIDMVMNQVALALIRGGNPVADAMESSYSVSRGRGVY